MNRKKILLVALVINLLFLGVYLSIYPLSAAEDTQPQPAAVQETPKDPGAQWEALRQREEALSIRQQELEKLEKQIDDIREKAKANHHSVKIGVNAFVIARDSEEEAQAVLQEIISKANVQAVKSFGEATREAGAASQEGEGNWAQSTFEDLVQYNDGFRTNLIGTPQQIAERIIELKKVGVDLILSGFLHFIEEIEYFGQKVLPLVRELEAQQVTPVQQEEAEPV